jgi:hypothetical protein
MVDIDGIQKCVDLLHDCYSSVIFAAYSQPAPNTTTHAHVWINCHSAVGADK